MVSAQENPTSRLPKKSLKASLLLTRAASAGAALQYCAGFVCPLAWSYVAYGAP